MLIFLKVHACSVNEHALIDVSDVIAVLSDITQWFFFSSVLICVNFSLIKVPFLSTDSSRLWLGKEKERNWCFLSNCWGEGDDRGWDGWMASRTKWTWVWVDSSSWWWSAVVHGVAKSRTRLSNWTEHLILTALNRKVTTQSP